MTLPDGKEAARGAALSRIVAGLPATIPFLGPEAIERRIGGALALRVGANESLFGPSPKAVAALRDAAFESALYGDPEGWALRVALSRHHGLTPDHIVLGCGVDELLGLVVQAYLDPGDAVVMSTGGYPTFAYHVSGHGGRFATVPYRDFRNDGSALVELARRERAKILYLANPDNPTGSWLDPAEIAALVDRLPGDCLLLLDEAYAEFLDPALVPKIAVDDPRVIRFRTFSKAHGMAGLRLGYVFGAPEAVRPLDRIRNQFGVGRLTQIAGLVSLQDTEHIARVVAEVAEGRADYARLADQAGCIALPSATNFVAFDLGTKARADALLKRLIEDYRVFVRKPAIAPLDRLVRITIGPRDARGVLAEALPRAVAAL